MSKKKQVHENEQKLLNMLSQDIKFDKRAIKKAISEKFVKLPTLKKVIEKYLEQGGERSFSIMESACHKEYLQIVEFFLDKGWDVNHQDRAGYTILHTIFDQNTQKTFELVTLFIKNKADVNAKSTVEYYCDTPLHRLLNKCDSLWDSNPKESEQRKFKIAELLIKNGAHLYVQNFHGIQPNAEKGAPSLITPYYQAFDELILAIEKHNNTDLEQLVNSPNIFSLSQPGKDGFTLLEKAVEAKNLFALDLLCKNGTDVNQKNQDGDRHGTALHLSAKNEFFEGAELLLKNKADPNIKNCDGYCPISFSVEKLNLEMIKLFIEYQADIKILDKYNYSLFHILCNVKNANVKIAKLLIEEGVDINHLAVSPEYSIFGSYAIHDACHEGSVKLVEYLLDHKIDPNLKNPYGTTLLFDACSSSLAMIQLLCDKKAELNVTDNSGNTLLHQASAWDKFEIVQFLIEQKLSVNAENKKLETPLHNTGNIHVAKLLLQEKANINAQGQNSNTPLHNACESGWRDGMIFFLIENKASLNMYNNENISPLGALIKKYHLKVLKKLIEEKLIDSNFTDSNQVSLLEYASTMRYYGECYSGLEIVGLLIEQKADVNQTFKGQYNGYKPLEYACSKNDTDLAYKFIAAGANLNELDKFGNTLLHRKCTWVSDIKIAKLLIKSKADVNLKSDNNETPLDLAKQFEINELVYWLEKAEKVEDLSGITFWDHTGYCDN